MFDTLWDKMIKLKLEETRLPVTFGKFGLTIEGSWAAFEKHGVRNFPFILNAVQPQSLN